MDIKRPDLRRKKKLKKKILSAALLIAILGGGFVLYSLEPDIPKVSRQDIWIGEVERGRFVHRIEGMGVLIPQEQRWITAQTQGRVEHINILPGAWVEEDSVILTLSNPDVMQELEGARLDMISAEAELSSAKVRLKGELLALQSSYKQLEESSKIADIEEKIDRDLAEKGLVSQLQLQRSEIRAQQLRERLALEQERLVFKKQSIKPELSVVESRLQRARSHFELVESQVSNLQVKAGSVGILQKLTIEAGVIVETGTAIAQVANPEKLKAVLQIAEGQAQQIEIGQRADIDTRTAGIQSGKVLRIDPNVDKGYVEVDIAFDNLLSDGCRPDQTIDGQITLREFSDVLHMNRPSGVIEDTTVSLFIIEGDYAVRRAIRFGKGSVSEIEVLSGLSEGSRVVLSDTTRWNEKDRLKLID